MIELRLFATFREGRDKVMHFDANKYHNVQSILKAVDILPEDVAILLVNGRHNKPDAKVKDGDVLAIFPPVGGG